MNARHIMPQSAHGATTKTWLIPSVSVLTTVKYTSTHSSTDYHSTITSIQQLTPLVPTLCSGVNLERTQKTAGQWTQGMRVCEWVARFIHNSWHTSDTAQWTIYNTVHLCSSNMSYTKVDITYWQTVDSVIRRGRLLPMHSVPAQQHSYVNTNSVSTVSVLCFHTHKITTVPRMMAYVSICTLDSQQGCIQLLSTSPKWLWANRSLTRLPPLSSTIIWYAPNSTDALQVGCKGNVQLLLQGACGCLWTLDIETVHSFINTSRHSLTYLVSQSGSTVLISEVIPS